MEAIEVGQQTATVDLQQFRGKLMATVGPEAPSTLPGYRVVPQIAGGGEGIAKPGGVAALQQLQQRLAIRFANPGVNQAISQFWRVTLGMTTTWAMSSSHASCQREIIIISDESSA